MSQALYRKYRPQTFAEVIGQQHIKLTLQRELEQDMLAHAYLFTGPRGLGKTTLARLLAKTVNCQKRKKGSAEPCNTCQSCKEITSNSSLDVIEIDAASHTGVDNVRDTIIEGARFTPSVSKYKVFIIDEVHMLSTSAFNALLKTLEEPPAHALFVLATTEIHKVPETIISRCQRFDFHKVSTQDLLKRMQQLIKLEKKKVDEDVLIMIARLSGGCVRDAESLLSQVLTLDDKHVTTEIASVVLPQSYHDAVLSCLFSVVRQQAAPALELIGELVDQGVRVAVFTEELVHMARRLLVASVSQTLDVVDLSMSATDQKKIDEILKLSTPQRLAEIAQRFLQVHTTRSISAIPQLPLEVAIVELCSTESYSNQSSRSVTHSANETQSVSKQSVSSPTQQAPDSDEEKKEGGISKKSDNKTSQDNKEYQKLQVNSGSFSVEQLLERWSEVIAGVKEHNVGLAAMLASHIPIAIRADQTIELAAQVKFHQDRINDSKNKRIIEEALQKVYGITAVIDAVKVDKMPQNKVEIISSTEASSSETDVNQLLESFGGQLVE